MDGQPPGGHLGGGFIFFLYPDPWGLMLQFDEHIFSDGWQKNTNELYTAPIHFCVQELQRKISIQEAAAVKKREVATEC